MRPACRDDVRVRDQARAGAARCWAGRWTPGCRPRWVTARRGLRPGRQVPGLAGRSAAIGYVVAVDQQAGQSRATPGPRAPTSWPRTPRTRPGSGAAAATGAKGPRVFDWAGPRPCPMTARRQLLVPVPAGAPLDRPATPRRAGTRLLPVLRPGRHARRGAGPGGRHPLGHRGDASRPPRTSPASTTTRSAATTPGTGTSPSPCSPTPTSPSPRRPPQKPWQRPHPGHPRRGPPSPGTPDHPDPQPRRSLGLV